MMSAADGDKSADVSEYIRPLLLAAAPPLLADGRIELHTLHLQDNLACGLIEFPTGAGPMLYNIGINPALKQWSPGVVAVAMSIQRAITNGAIEYDLLRGREPYKYKIGGTDRPIYRLVMKR